MSHARAVLSLVVAVVALLAGAASASEQRPTLSELEGQVMCPSCHTPLDQSESPAADRIRAFIRARIRAGDTRSEIKERLAREFGPAILAAPPRKGFDLLAWWLPVVGVAGGGIALAVLAWRWSAARGEAGVPAVSASADGLPPELERRVDEELARFEA